MTAAARIATSPPRPFTFQKPQHLGQRALDLAAFKNSRSCAIKQAATGMLSSAICFSLLKSASQCVDTRGASDRAEVGCCLTFFFQVANRDDTWVASNCKKTKPMATWRASVHWLCFTATAGNTSATPIDSLKFEMTDSVYQHCTAGLHPCKVVCVAIDKCLLIIWPTCSDDRS